ncbi:hypothetical protein MJO28_008452 [Puccinia striiformis f. sp. tritici]|uniref:Uncharacterized protein n=1 Tax=Puccinia striiformis f. sp. tritici TaxID=168172 RepID=A0ACC0EC87_9BASI|nr:hypothetical protein MJO28_008452 [Puccinia striiformis f. sp. tritici]
MSSNFSENRSRSYLDPHLQDSSLYFDHQIHLNSHTINSPRYLNGTMAANLNAAAGIITAPANAGDAAEGIGATTEQSNQISLSPAEQAVYNRDMQPFVKNAIEAIPKLTLSNFTVWKANFETFSENRSRSYLDPHLQDSSLYFDHQIHLLHTIVVLFCCLY